jgi:hypothetical protein
MPSFPHQRQGKLLTVGKHRVSFTLYAGQREKPHRRMLASNPWRCMELALLRAGRQSSECLAYLRQAHDFHIASEAAKATARPLLMYYSFLNLAKMLIKHQNGTIDLTRASHGISEPKTNTQRNRFTLTSQSVRVQSPPKHGIPVPIFLELTKVLEWRKLRPGTQYDVCELLAQVPAIHRAYCHIRRQEERLYLINEAEFRYNHSNRTAWVMIWIKQSEFGSRKILKEARSRSYFSEWFEQVESDPDHEDFIPFQSKTENYGRSPTEPLPELGRHCKHAGIVSILTPNGYRYYLTNFQPKLRVCQILASYMAMFYFNSVARYRPADYEKMLTRRFGWAIEEFLSSQGHQFVYLIANALLKQEVVAPWALRSQGADL